MCEDCRKYTVSCRVLEGFECCKCCGIIECEYDICPQEEKIIKGKERTVYEFNTLSDLSWEINNVNNAKNAFIEDRYDKYYHRRVGTAQEELRKLRKEIKADTKLSNQVKSECLESIRCALISCNDLYFYIKAKFDKDKSKLKKTTFNYIKKYLNRFSAKAIGKNKILCREEKVQLLTKKGIKNPLSLIE